MKLAYATTFSVDDVSSWSGTPFHMAKAFRKEGVEIEAIGNLKRRLPPFFKLKQTWKKIACQQRESPRFNITAAKYYSEQVAQQLKKLSVDAIIAPQINPIAYLDVKQPVVLWTDAVYCGLIGFYPVFCNHSAESIRQGNIITQECLSRCKLAIFSSDWAARNALELYGTSTDKVKVVPYGANITASHTQEDIRNFIKSRPRDCLKLLFIGKHWHRKGGDIVFHVTNALHEAGHNVELNFVGCMPPEGTEIPSYIKCHGFISKRTPEGVKKLNELFQNSHFLFLPSRAEACAIAFCEASAFGLPTLTSYVGGIPTAVKDHVNGMTFALDAEPDVYCSYIMQLMQNYSQYEELALSSFNEYQTRLNWGSAVKQVKELIMGAL